MSEQASCESLLVQYSTFWRYWLESAWRKDKLTEQKGKRPGEFFNVYRTIVCQLDSVTFRLCHRFTTVNWMNKYNVVLFYYWTVLKMGRLQQQLYERLQNNSSRLEQKRITNQYIRERLSNMGIKKPDNDVTKWKRAVLTSNYHLFLEKKLLSCVFYLPFKPTKLEQTNQLNYARDKYVQPRSGVGPLVMRKGS